MTTINDIVLMVAENDTKSLNLICQIVKMSDDAKHILRTKGYGWTGLDLLKTCELVPNNEE